MGLRGAPPKPTAIERAEGFPGKRKPSRYEPQPEELTIADALKACPKYLPKETKRWWRYYAPILAGIRVLTTADLMALEGLSQATAERTKYEGKLAESGPLYQSPKSGYIQVSPLYSVVQSLRERETKLLREFGMTPSSRTRVSIAGDPSQDGDLARLLSLPRAARTETAVQ